MLQYTDTSKNTDATGRVLRTGLGCVATHGHEQEHLRLRNDTHKDYFALAWAVSQHMDTNKNTDATERHTQRLFRLGLGCVTTHCIYRVTHRVFSWGTLQTTANPSAEFAQSPQQTNKQKTPTTKQNKNHTNRSLVGVYFYAHLARTVIRAG